MEFKASRLASTKGLEDLELVRYGRDAQDVSGIQEQSHSAVELALAVGLAAAGSGGRELSGLAPDGQKYGWTLANGQNEARLRLNTELCDGEVGNARGVEQSCVVDWSRLDDLLARLADLWAAVVEHAAEGLGVDVFWS